MYYIRFLILFIASNSFAQKFDNLQQVQDFINHYSKNEGDLVIPSINEFYSFDEYIHIADSLKIKPWNVGDFNNDGINDLLSICINKSEERTFFDENRYLVFLSDSIHQYTCHNLIYDPFQYADWYSSNGKGCLVFNNIFPQIIKQDSITYIKLNVTKRQKKHLEYRYNLKEVLFKNIHGYFVEASDNINRDQLNSFTFSRSDPWPLPLLSNDYKVKVFRNGDILVLKYIENDRKELKRACNNA